MTTQLLFTLLISLGGFAGIAYGLFVVRRGEITLQRGTTTQTFTGQAARRIGTLIVIGAIVIMLIGLLVLRPLL